ncbi:MAG: shikimate dehydrogenase [Pararhodobacter sp.]
MSTGIRLAAVIGNPITHSRSPVLHGHWLQRHGIKGQYVPLQVRENDLEACLHLLPRIGFAGINVTLPHKEAVLRLADSCSATAQRIGAANTLTFVNETIEADNTDAYGFTWNILDHAPGWEPGLVAVIGAGGASRAVVAALLDRGAQTIRITNRRMERSEQIANDFGGKMKVVPWQERHAMLAECDTLINATSLGMQNAPPLDLTLDDLPANALVNDLVYAPLKTDLLKRATARGNLAIDGLGMLLHQAVPGFERWFGIKPMVDKALRDAVLAP